MSKNRRPVTPRVGSLRMGAAAMALAAVALTGCVSTNTARPYTPGVGVNADQSHVKLRGLTVVSNAEGRGVLAGAVDSRRDDTLTKVSGFATDSDFQDQGSLQTGSATISIPAGTLVSLSEQKISLSSEELKPGLYARVVFTFEKAGEVAVLVPVVDAENPDYESIQPQG